MMSTVVEFFKKYGKCIPITKTCREPSLAKFPPIICNDGTFISAQAGENYKCYPKENLESFEYEEVEIRRDEVVEQERLLKPFEDSWDTYIYPNVPVEVLDEIISRHGGIDIKSVEAIVEKINK